MKDKNVQLAGDPLWYKDAVIYELHVKSFFDSNNDGIGDFKGLSQKVDYLERLGVTAVWLLPFYPSPLRDDGYDIADYFKVNPQYGTLRDFQTFLREAHQRGIRVITELVVNHTSDQHEWFQKSRRAKTGSPWRDFYVWSDTPDKYMDARIIFTDFETSNWTWDPVAKAYFWHRFYSHQPDLNYDNPAVEQAILKVVDFWFDLGVDGVRMDAVPYLYEREGGNCENLPETYQYLERLRAHIDSKYEDKLILAEANQWPEDTAKYFGDGNQCHMAFHFPLMPRLFAATWMEDSFPIIDILEQTPEIPENCQWAIFLRNHDELTLEMVSDEERDYMYSVYAQDPSMRINVGIRRRLAPLLGNDRRKIELMNILLLSLPGTPVFYYGDELGMGDNHYLGDRDGVRTAMQWSGDRNAGFSHANPQKLFLPVIIDPDYHHQSINVENQERSLSSLLWWLRRKISIRKQFKAFGRGSFEIIPSDNPKVLSFIRAYEDEIVLVVVNLSRFAQTVSMDLQKFSGYVPEEAMSGNTFPAIGEDPAAFMLGAYDSYWFSLVDRRQHRDEDDGDLRELIVKGPWEQVFQKPVVTRFEKEVLPGFLAGRRWFGGKARARQHIKVLENAALVSGGRARICLIEVLYKAGSSESYMLLLSFALGDGPGELRDNAAAVLCRIQTPQGTGILYDAVYDAGFRRDVLKQILKKKKSAMGAGQLVAHTGGRNGNLSLPETVLDNSHVVKAEQSNTSIVYDNQVFLKLFRRQSEGENPDLEMGRFLTEQAKFSHIASYAGDLEFIRPGSKPMVLGLLQRYIPNRGDAWTLTIDAATRFFELILEKGFESNDSPKLPASPLDLVNADIPSQLLDLIGLGFLEYIKILGQRTAEMHLALNTETQDPGFASEPFTLPSSRRYSGCGAKKPMLL